MSKLYDTLVPILEKNAAYNTALSLFYYDNSTQAPTNAINNTSKAMSVLAMESYYLMTSDHMKQLLEELSCDKEHAKLTDYEKRTVKNLKKSLDDMEKIPPDELQAYMELTTKANQIWAHAKADNNYDTFKGTLNEILSYQKKFADYCKKDAMSQYDYHLNEHEEGFLTTQCDDFFNRLKEALVPLMQKVFAKNNTIRTDFLSRSFDVSKQAQFCDILKEHIGLDSDRSITGESEHPFTLSLHNHDVRFTNHFHENMIISSFFSAIHEGGHALYEMGVDDQLTMKPLGNIESMAMHESQSRLYENNLGRTKEFWTPLWPKLTKMFPVQFADVTLDEFYLAINKSQPSLIRTESDELSYSLHVIIRYEIEKMLFDGSITVDDVPTIWNEKYTQYLGVTPSNDSEGVLQDMHWSSGFGYFPSYVIGSAISAQMMSALRKNLPVDQLLLEGNLIPIKDYLDLHVHQFGSARNSKEILNEMTNEDFNPQYFIDYLTEKYTKLYNL